MEKNVDVRLQEEGEEGESEGEGDFPNEEGDGGEEMDEEKIVKPKVTSDSDDEAPAVLKEEITTTNPNSSAKQRSAPKKLMNQFNFFERCALTEEIILRVVKFNTFYYIKC